MYNDDGLQNEAYEKGQFEMMNFEAKNNGKTITFELENEVGANFSAKSKNIELVIHNVFKNPNSVKAGCKKLEYTYDSEKKTLKVNLVWDSSKDSNQKTSAPCAQIIDDYGDSQHFYPKKINHFLFSKISESFKLYSYFLLESFYLALFTFYLALN